jgi:flagellar basal body-associated protein FliL
MAEKEQSAEVQEPEAAGPTRTRLLALVGAAAIAVALGATGYLVFGGDDGQSQSAESPSSTEGVSEATSYPATAAAGIDYEAELGVILPLAMVSSEGGEGEASSSHIGKVIPLDSFVVNISDRERDRYLKLKAELELSIPELSDELDQRMPQIRDLIISLLGSKSFEEVRTIEGKNFLREEMLLRINALLVSGKVKRVFFTEFVVQ